MRKPAKVPVMSRVTVPPSLEGPAVVMSLTNGLSWLVRSLMPNFTLLPYSIRPLPPHLHNA
jgi:hypothetical protein